MKITIEHHNDQFNVSLSSGEGKEAFVTIKGCRVVDGTKGRFISFPSRTLDSGKYWNHVYASEQFQAAILAEFDKSAQKPAKPVRSRDMDDAPF
jgi:DNA-binding cell septation regulator SpoVG